MTKVYDHGINYTCINKYKVYGSHDHDDENILKSEK